MPWLTETWHQAQIQCHYSSQAGRFRIVNKALVVLIPQRPDLNHTPQPESNNNRWVAPSQTKPQRLWPKDRHLQPVEAAVAYSVKRHFLSVGLVILIGIIGLQLSLHDQIKLERVPNQKRRCISIIRIYTYICLREPDDFRHE
jgi:hypothetical protein